MQIKYAGMYALHTYSFSLQLSNKTTNKYRFIFWEQKCPSFFLPPMWNVKNYLICKKLFFLKVFGALNPMAPKKCRIAFFSSFFWMKHVAGTSNVWTNMSDLLFYWSLLFLMDVLFIYYLNWYIKSFKHISYQNNARIYFAYEQHK